ncbi:MAG: diguanylate cyclase [Defluviitaleaceae bacterium]|nr:diguanylate cyclase [Defluviitaleaceae bacterium]
MNYNSSKQCILIIEDSPMQLKALENMLSPLYDILKATNGHDGVELAFQSNVDLILLDLILPCISGFEVLYKLKESELTKDIPVIFITGMDSSEDEANGLASGAVDYIRKPLVSAVVRLRVGIHLRLVSQMKTIENFSLTDGLTGIKNRRSFEKEIKAEWSRATRKQEMLSLLMLDVDYFKKFNDRHGHLHGDTCLKTVAAVMESTLMRGSDSVFRWGGEEFAILLPVTPIEGAIIVAEKTRKNIAAMPIHLTGETVFVTASIGVGTIAPNLRMDFTETFRDFHAQLDKALYRAKANGRNRIEAI